MPDDDTGGVDLTVEDPRDRARDRSRMVRLDHAMAALRARLADRGIDLDAEMAEVDWSAVDADGWAQWHADRDAIRVASWAACVPPEFTLARLPDVPDVQRGPLAEWVTRPSPSRSGAPRPNVVLVGPVGVGKTHAAFAVGHALVDLGEWCTATTTVDYLNAARPSGDGTIVDRVHAAPYLILDDLGTEAMSEWAVAQVTGLLDIRYREHRPSIVTTNATYTDLAMSLGDRIMSRLTGGAVITTLEGPDRRATRW